VLTAARVALCGVLILAASCAQRADERSILLVSGRDDHGFLANEVVGLLNRPDGHVVFDLPDGALVGVESTYGEWIEVSALDGDPVSGWINDFYLRGTVHVVGDRPACPTPLVGEPGASPFAELRPSEQVEIVDAHRIGGELWVGVKPLQSSELGLVPQAWIQELPGPVASAGTPCDLIEVSEESPPHRH